MKPQAKITIDYLLDLLKVAKTDEECRAITDTIENILNFENVNALVYDKTHEEITSIIN